MLTILLFPFTLALSLVRLAFGIVASLLKLVTFSVSNLVTIAGLCALGYVVYLFLG